jgi:asparagine synthase (glutamine-hydrolysing)
MCGLSAIVEFGSEDRLVQSLLEMHDRIPHRGPDGEGFTLIDAGWQAVSAKSAHDLRALAPSDWRIGMAFRWLQIQDPGETAAQPMASPDGSVWLTFNGEIYNFRELRGELEGLGHRFASVSDTEVLLAAYLRWGSGCFGRLNGMWSIILIDLRERKMIISRDRFGIKPLFYHHGPGRLIVASEIKQLLAGGAPALANRAALGRFVRGRRPSSPEETFFKDIFAQPAATYAEISLQEPPQQICFQSYWRLDLPARGEIARAPPIETASATLEQLLTQSVREHMVAQARFGHLISGGLDSSLLAALAAPVYSSRHESGMGASMVLEPALKALDESVYIDELTQALGFKNFKAELSAHWLKANIARVTWTQEEPVAGMAVAGQFLAYETAARHGAKVVIDGQGADEFFAGYPRHQVTLLMDHVRNLAWADCLREVMWLLWCDPGFLWGAWRRRIVSRLARALRPDRGRRAYDFLRESEEGTAAAAAAPSTVAASALNRELLTDVLSYNLKSVLAVTDRNSMTHSIEARVPYVDLRIADLAFRLPDDYKVGRGRRKRILRVIAERYLPRAIVQRVDRIGFGAPIESWLTNDFRAEVAALLTGGVFSGSALVDPVRLSIFIKDFLSGRNRDFGAVWRLYAIDLWARIYGVSGL